MNKSFLPLTLGAAVLVGLLIPADAARPSTELGDSSVIVLPSGLMNEVRDTSVTVPMQVQLYNSGDATVQLDHLLVQTASGQILSSVDLARESLAGDGGFYGDLLRDMEVIDPEITHKHRNRFFVPLESRDELDPAIEAEMMMDIIDGVSELVRSGAPQKSDVTFDISFQDLFPESSQPGDVAEMEVVLTYTTSQGQATAACSNSITLLAPFLGPPAQSRQQLNAGTGDWFRGDLHVHNCRDEASGGCNDCPAESFNTSGAFTNADLKPMFQALGFDFFSSTTHSYCINSDSEFSDVLAESNTLTDSSFIVLASTEISGKETGPQLGGDLADALCLLGWGSDVHHMGGHAITSRKPGGRDGFLDFCDNPLFSFQANARAVGEEGGFIVANHPDASTWAFNSVNDFFGRERAAAHGAYGVEVWNGSETPDHWFMDHRRWLVARLKEGKIIYPYSGSDTHDTPYNFGAVHTWVEGGFVHDNLRDGLKSGRHYISNGPFVSIDLADRQGRTAAMGEIVNTRASKVPANYPLDGTIDYNVGASKTAVIKLYRGIQGQDAIVLAQETVSGSGTMTYFDTYQPAGSFYYWAELEVENHPEAAMSSLIYIRVR